MMPGWEAGTITNAPNKKPAPIHIAGIWQAQLKKNLHYFMFCLAHSSCLF